jgi:hypothetical protein
MFKFANKSRKSNLLLEVLMIVVGINVALWFEGWFEDLQDAEIAARYLEDLRSDLETDISSLDQAIASGEAKSQRAGEIIDRMPEIGDLPPEQLAQAIYTPATYLFFTPSDFTYRSMRESGDFRLLRNSGIKKRILKLDRRHKDIAMLQANYLQALDDGYIPLMMNNFDISSSRITDTSMLEDQFFRNFFVYTKQDTDTMVALYRMARDESEALVELIEQEIDN